MKLYSQICALDSNVPFMQVLCLVSVSWVRSVVHVMKQTMRQVMEKRQMFIPRTLNTLLQASKLDYSVYMIVDFILGPGSEVEVTYNQILNTFCKTKLELQEEIDLDVSPCSLWKALHNGEQCMALVYNGEGDKLKFTKYIEDVQKNKPNVMPAKCIHFDTKLYSHPVVLFEVHDQQPLKEYCFSSEALSEIQQLSLLLDAAISVLAFSPDITLQLTTESLFVQTSSTNDTESLFVHKSSTNDTKAMFLPIYEQSYFHQLEPKIKPELPSLNWLNDSLLLMVHRKQCSSNSKLPENHILFNIFKHRWFPDDKLGSSSTVTADVAKELKHILGK